jgi:hypothetical protein
VSSCCSERLKHGPRRFGQGTFAGNLEDCVTASEKSRFVKVRSRHCSTNTAFETDATRVGELQPLSFPLLAYYFHTVGDLNERNALVHPIVLAIKGHRSVDASGGGSLAAICQSEFFSFRDAANRKVSFQVE